MTGLLATCALSLLGMQPAQAQTPGNAYVSGNSLTGNQTDPWGVFFMTAGNGQDAASHFRIFGPSHSSHGTMDYNAGWSPNNPSNFSHRFHIRPNNNNDVFIGLGIRQDGKVQIGDRTPTTQTNYKLAVDGQIVSTSIYVTSPTTWADFVFEPSYEPMALPTLESYLKKNKHLPYIPSAKEVETNGYNVAEMDAKLLQTVEELTLQVITLNKQNIQARAEIAQTQAEMAELRARMAEFTARKKVKK